MCAKPIDLWDTASGRKLSSLPGTFAPAAFQAAGDYHGLVRFWDTSSGREIGQPLPQREIDLALAYSPDGKTLAVGLAEVFTHKPGTRLWDTATGRPIGELLPSVAGVTRIEFRPDGRALLTCGGSTRLWDAVRAQAMGEEIIDDQAGGFRPDGRVFLTLGSDRFDKSAADYREAERLGKRDDVRDFQIHCVVDCTKAERWAEALWYLDRLIAARPGDGTLHEDRAAVYGKLGREAERQAELASVFALGADEGLVIARAEELGRGGRWAEAAGLLARGGRAGPLSSVLAQAWGIACLRAGDRAGYREACAAFMDYQGPDPTVVWNALAAASFFALGAEGLDDYRVPMRWIERRLSASPTLNPVIKHYFSNVLGGLSLRAGRLDDAIGRVNEGIAAANQVELPTDWAHLALAHALKGNLAEARRGHAGESQPPNSTMRPCSRMLAGPERASAWA